MEMNAKGCQRPLVATCKVGMKNSFRAGADTASSYLPCSASEQVCRSWEKA